MIIDQICKGGRFQILRQHHHAPQQTLLQLSNCMCQQTAVDRTVDCDVHPTAGGPRMSGVIRVHTKKIALL